MPVPGHASRRHASRRGCAVALCSAAGHVDCVPLLQLPAAHWLASTGAQPPALTRGFRRLPVHIWYKCGIAERKGEAWCAMQRISTGVALKSVEHDYALQVCQDAHVQCSEARSARARARMCVCTKISDMWKRKLRPLGFELVGGWQLLPSSCTPGAAWRMSGMQGAACAAGAAGQRSVPRGARGAGKGAAAPASHRDHRGPRYCPWRRRMSSL